MVMGNDNNLPDCVRYVYVVRRSNSLAISTRRNKSTKTFFVGFYSNY
jgi:hypothetical protein